MQTSGDHPPRTRDTWLMAMLGLAGLVLIAGTASYLHALSVVQAADGHHLVAWFIPSLADLLILTAGANILDSARCGEGWPRWSIISAITGVLVTLGLNVAAGDPGAVPVYLVNGWPPVAFLLGAESFMGLIRRGRGGASVSPAPATTGQCPHGLASNKDEAAVLAYLHDRDCLDKASFRETGRQFGMRHDRVAALVKAAAGVDVAGAAHPPAVPATLNGSAASE